MVIKTFQKIIKGEYLLLYIVLYIVTFAITNYVIDKEYTGKFYIDYGLNLAEQKNYSLGREYIKHIDKHIQNLGLAEIPKKYKNDGEHSVVYISGKSKSKVLERADEVLKTIDVYKNKNLKSSLIENAIVGELYFISKELDRTYKYIDLALLAFAGQEKIKLKTIEIHCADKGERFYKTNSLCLLYRYKILKHANYKKRKNDIHVEIKKRSQAYEFERAQFIGIPIIESHPSIKNKIYELSFLISILGFLVLGIFKTLILIRK